MKDLIGEIYDECYSMCLLGVDVQCDGEGGAGETRRSRRAKVGKIQMRWHFAMVSIVRGIKEKESMKWEDF